MGNTNLTLHHVQRVQMESPHPVSQTLDLGWAQHVRIIQADGSTLEITCFLDQDAAEPVPSVPF